MHRNWVRLCLALLVIAALVGAAVGCVKKERAQPLEPIKLGVLVPLTGPAAATGQEMRNVYLLAADQVNAEGGVLGRRVEILFEDSKDPTTAVTALEKLITRDGVQILMGEISSTVTYALAAPAKKYAPIMAWTGAASTKVEQAFADVDWFFHYHPWEYHNIQAIVSMMKALGATSAVLAHEDGLFGSSSADMIKEMFPREGLQLLASEPFKSGSADFTPLLTKLKGYGADLFIWIGYPADAIPITTQCKEVDFAPKAICVPSRAFLT